MRILQQAVHNGRLELGALKRRTSNRAVSARLVSRVRHLDSEGKTRLEIIAATGLAASTVSKILRKKGRFA